MKTVKVEWTKGEGGRWNMAEVPGTEKTYEADYVFLGETPLLALARGTHAHTHTRMLCTEAARHALLLTSACLRTT